MASKKSKPDSASVVPHSSKSASQSVKAAASSKPAPKSEPSAAPKAAKKTNHPTPPEKTATQPAAEKTGEKTSLFSNEEIALRAYYIAEERHRNRLPGNANQDWLKAEEQLRAEAAAGKEPKGKSKGKK